MHCPGCRTPGVSHDLNHLPCRVWLRSEETLQAKLTTPEFSILLVQFKSSQEDYLLSGPSLRQQCQGQREQPPAERELLAFPGTPSLPPRDCHSCTHVRSPTLG